MYGSTSEDNFANTKVFCVCCSALRILPRKSLAETNPMDGCIFPYETRGVPPFLVGDGMYGSLSLAYDASLLPSLSLPF